MKNTLIVIIGIAILSALGYVVFSRPSDSTNTTAQSVTTTPGAVVAASGDITYSAGAYQDFSQSAYEQALTDGKTVILDFHADWCPTCRANEPIIESVFQSNTNLNLIGFKVNYDTEIALKKIFNIASQSTIIKTSKDAASLQLGPGPVTVESFTAFIQS